MSSRIAGGKVDWLIAAFFWLLDDFRGHARFEPISTKYGRVNFLACEKVTEVASFLGSPACRQINMQVRHLTE